jgi:hypothetical protein
MEEPTEQAVRPGAVIRDVFIIVVLTAVGGFVVGFTMGIKSSAAMLAIALSNMVFGTIGFIISGCLAKGNRWWHLAWVGIGVWLAGLINVFAFGFGIVQWIFSVVAIGIMMGLGGGLSYFFRKDDDKLRS